MTLRDGGEQSRRCSADRVFTKQFGGWQQATLGRPGQADLADRSGVGDFHVVQRPARGVGRSLVQRRHDRDAEPGGHETTHGWQVVAFEADRWLESGLLAKVVVTVEAAQPRMAVAVAAAVWRVPVPSSVWR